MKIIKIWKRKKGWYSVYFLKTDNGETYTFKELAEITGVKVNTLKNQVLKQKKKTFSVSKKQVELENNSSYSTKDRSYNLARIPSPTKYEMELYK